MVSSVRIERLVRQSLCKSMTCDGRCERRCAARLHPRVKWLAKCPAQWSAFGSHDGIAVLEVRADALLAGNRHHA
jgi:hypothetical protein